MDMVHNAFEVERVQALRFIRKVCNNSTQGFQNKPVTAGVPLAGYSGQIVIFWPLTNILQLLTFAKSDPISKY